MRALGRWLVAGIVLLLGRGRRPAHVERGERIVPPGPPSPRAELFVLTLFGATAACAQFLQYLDTPPVQAKLVGAGVGLPANPAAVSALADPTLRQILTYSKFVVTQIFSSNELLVRGFVGAQGIARTNAGSVQQPLQCRR